MKTARAYWSIFKIETTQGFQYRIAFLAGASTSVFWVLIEIVVYTVFYTYANNSTAAGVAAMTLPQVVSYAWIGQLLFLIQPMSIDGEILSKITSGDIGIELCRPMDLYAHWFAHTAATRLTPLFWRGSIILLFGMLLPRSLRLSPPCSAAGLVCMLISVASAILLCTSFAMLVCAVRMSITWGEGPTYIMMLVGGVLFGGYLPLQLWPKFMQSFLFFQPFCGYLDIPLRFYLGSLSAGKGMLAIGLQLTWSFVFILIGRILMQKQLKSIIVQGG